MKRINSLSDLLMEELADLLNAENQLVEVLPKMAQASESLALKIVLEDHLEVSKEQAERIQGIFNNIQQNPQEVISKVMRGFIAESEDVVNKIEKSPARDAAIISVVQRMEQYEITGYQTACQHAEDLGHTRIMELFNEILNEERAMNLHLNELSQGIINLQAIDPMKTKSGGFYIPEGKLSRGGIKKKIKNSDVSRFISEGSPNSQEPQEKGEEQENKNLQNLEEQGDLS